MDERLEDYELPDGERHIRFKGVKLGHSSSQSNGKERWSEISIFRTEGGSYVVAGVGRTTLPNETDRHWAQVCERPQGVIERLYMLDHDSSRYLPRTSLQALNQARDRDPALNDAFLVQTVD
jgi:hypothetical protein